MSEFVRVNSFYTESRSDMTYRERERKKNIKKDPGFLKAVEAYIKPEVTDRESIKRNLIKRLK